jgi:uncharacterized 2Fe-2S/4Fe-4S cluster protein (DUF4445 family)
VACGLDLGAILPSGRLAAGGSFPLQAPVVLSQQDIRELQLAKGAIAAGLQTLLERLGLNVDGLERLYLAGAFGNYVSRQSARRIGLLPLPPEKAEPAGNTALLGAKQALFWGDELPERCSALARSVEHVPLNADPGFHESYLGNMAFPQEERVRS